MELKVIEGKTGTKTQIKISKKELEQLPRLSVILHKTKLKKESKYNKWFEIDGDLINEK